MSSAITAVADVFTAREIARAAGTDVRDVRSLIESGAIGTVDGRFVAPAEAIRAVRMLAGAPDAEVPVERPLFGAHAAAARSHGRALTASLGVHALMLVALTALMTRVAAAPVPVTAAPPVRLVFLATPGPGGGGGGGGLKLPAPPPKAELKGTRPLRSPIPPPKPVVTRKPEPEAKPLPPVRPEPEPKPVEPPPPPVPAPVAPQVAAPVATLPADARDRTGVAADAPDSRSQGPGAGSGAGSGTGTGMGEGTGSGIGPGSGGGTGGGPYRPGTGITPPAIVHEVKPDYTDEGRRRHIEGDVVLEIIVRSDGSVGNVKLVQGLGAGLDQRAMDAVRQWRFSPAKRYGVPVDVIVEVAMEFKLR